MKPEPSSPSDIGTAAQVDAAAAFAVDEFGKLDVMVNNAGICVLGPLHLLTSDDFDRMIAVNLKGAFHGIKAAVPRMPNSDSIISTSSTAGLNGAPLLGGYGATKAGIINITKTAAAELRPAGIRVNCVCPAFTETPFSDALIAGFEAATGASAQSYFAEKQGRFGQPDDIAKVVLHLASNDAGWVTGVGYPVDGGLMAASIGWRASSCWEPPVSPADSSPKVSVAVRRSSSSRVARSRRLPSWPTISAGDARSPRSGSTSPRR